jgi:multiple sugar transport system permease protein
MKGRAAPGAPVTGWRAGEPTASTARYHTRTGHFSTLTRQDRIVLAVMVALPLILTLGLIWVPTIVSVGLSFTRWNGIGGLENIVFVGTDNYTNLVTAYPYFWPAVQHNLIWLGVYLFIATPLGMFLAVLLDRDLRGKRIYQSVLYLPAVLSLAIVGFIWELQYSPDQGLINSLLGTAKSNQPIDWLGTPGLNLGAVLVASCWRQVGYIMILYLAGLKTIDPTLREAATIDGANERQIFRHVVFPLMLPINIVVLVVTTIDSLRAFDIVYTVNKGLNGLELLSVLVTNNIIGEASRLGYGSAIAVVLLLVSLVPISIFLARLTPDRAR